MTVGGEPGRELQLGKSVRSDRLSPKVKKKMLWRKEPPELLGKGTVDLVLVWPKDVVVEYPRYLGTSVPTNGHQPSR